MAEYFTHDLILHLIVFQAVVLLIVLSNIRLTTAPGGIFPRLFFQRCRSLSLRAMKRRTLPLRGIAFRAGLSLVRGDCPG